MPHTRKKVKKDIPKKYIPIESTHCNINDVINSIYYCIKTNWITEEEFDNIYKQIKKRIKSE